MLKILCNKFCDAFFTLFANNKNVILTSSNESIDYKKKRRGQKLSSLDRQEIEKRIDQLLQTKNKDLTLSRREAAVFLGMQETTLAMWKSNKRYPLPYIKMGNHVRYKIGDLAEFMSSMQSAK